MKYRCTHPQRRGYAIIKVNGDNVVGVLANGQAVLTALPQSYMTFTAFPRLYGWEQVKHQLIQDGWQVAVEAEGPQATESMPTNEKVAMWCRLYKHFKGASYAVNGKDAGMLGQMSITEALLTYYLDDKNLPENATTWLWRGKQSVRNLQTYFNEVRTAMLAPAPPASKHPNQWAAGHAAKLDGHGLTEYYQHLKSLGLTAKRARDGSIIDWVPNGTQQ